MALPYIDRKPEINPNEPHVYRYIVPFDRRTNNVDKYVPPRCECDICGSLEETEICVRTIYDLSSNIKNP